LQAVVMQSATVRVSPALIWTSVVPVMQPFTAPS
jgi:hypothetical protein